MCGIAGFIDRSKDQQVLDSMTCALERRGPDDSGLYFNEGVALGHRRLSIIDLSAAGHQPMRFEDLVIVFNGEIYNYREVQEQLKKEGYSFQSHSDTEVAIKAFHCWGPECVQRFIGMFAIAIYNETKAELTLIRDRAGVKPLYYYYRDGRIAFASELKSFKTYLSAAERNEIDPVSLSEFLSIGYITGGRSILKAVKKLPQGHYLRFAQGRMALHRYWQVEFRENRDWLNRSDEDVLDELEELTLSAFKYRMVADVPVGVFLSAGIDSSLVTAILSKHYGQLRTFTIGFNEKGFDESSEAKKIADHLNSIHTERTLTADKAYEILDQFYDIFDEPHGDNSCVPTTFVSQLAKESGVKVVLSADAGDELFGGYVRYTEYIQRWNQLKKLGSLGRVGARAALSLAGSVAPEKRAEKFNRFSDILGRGSFIDFYQTIIRMSSDREMKRVYPGYDREFFGVPEDSLLNQMCQWDFDHYMVDDILIKVDRATMYHSIEGREPFLDHRLVEFAAQLPGHFKIRDGETKFILKKLLGRYLPKKLYDLPKRGFGAPLQQWIREHYKDRFREVLSGSNQALFNKKEIDSLLGSHKSGGEMNYILLWYLFSFQSWYDKWTRNE